MAALMPASWLIAIQERGLLAAPGVKQASGQPAELLKAARILMHRSASHSLTQPCRTAG